MLVPVEVSKTHLNLFQIKIKNIQSAAKTSYSGSLSIQEFKHIEQIFHVDKPVIPNALAFETLWHVHNQQKIVLSKRKRRQKKKLLTHGIHATNAYAKRNHRVNQSNFIVCRRDKRCEWRKRKNDTCISAFYH